MPMHSQDQGLYNMAWVRDASLKWTLLRVRRIEGVLVAFWGAPEAWTSGAVAPGFQPAKA